MRDRLPLLIVVLLCNASLLAQATHPLKLIREDASLLKAPATFSAGEEFKTTDPQIQALNFEGKPFKGNPTRVFAWMGVPKVEPGKKVPGMVLIHGGGGTAFEAWVKLWVSRGYAAIAMDTCGQVPLGSYGKWKRAEQGGPPGWNATFAQIEEPMTDQWPYHAVTSVLQAHSLLRAQAGVDVDRIGVTGISWGGYLTCLVAGADPRFKFAVPVYGCGFIDLCTWRPILEKMPAQQRDRWIAWWDPRHWLAESNLPMLWVTGTNDFAYPFDALQKSYRQPRAPRTLCVRLRMAHGHGGAGEKPAEILTFADSFFRAGAGLAKVTGAGRDGQTAWATFDAKTPIKAAELLYTKDTGPWQKRKWETLPATLATGKITAKLPEGTRVYYLNLIDANENVVSTEHEEQ